ncbi:MAG: hypothetical protein ACOY32_03805 [Thermodesulfobacteriota bacterium]
MKHFNAPGYPDTQGLAALLNYFGYLQEKRLAEVNKARHDVDELKKLVKQASNRKKLSSENTK